MKPRYIDCLHCVAVLTPHFLEQCQVRRYLLPVNWHIEDYLDAIWDASEVDVTFGVQFGRVYVYGRKRFNEYRDRWEIEMISVTPTTHFHTQNAKFAKLIKLK